MLLAVICYVGFRPLSFFSWRYSSLIIIPQSVSPITDFSSEDSCTIIQTLLTLVVTCTFQFHSYPPFIDISVSGHKHYRFFRSIPQFCIVYAWWLVSVMKASVHILNADSTFIDRQQKYHAIATIVAQWADFLWFQLYFLFLHIFVRVRPWF